MEKYYPLVDQMYNEGGLTLVVKEFVPQAKELIQLVRLLATKDMSKKKKDSVLKDAIHSIQGNNNLYKMLHTKCNKQWTISYLIIKHCHCKVILKNKRTV